MRGRAGCSFAHRGIDAGRAPVGDNDTDIFVANIDGSNATRVTTTGDNYQPTWSPDSTRLAFTSTRDGDYNIYTIRADGLGLTRLTSDPGNEVTPTWGILELPAGIVAPAPLAQLPFGAGAVALTAAPSFRRREDDSEYPARGKPC